MGADRGIHRATLRPYSTKVRLRPLWKVGRPCHPPANPFLCTHSCLTLPIGTLISLFSLIVALLVKRASERDTSEPICVSLVIVAAAAA